jgi:cytochrome c-type biogenesis protein
MDDLQQALLVALNAQSGMVLLFAFLGGVASSLLPCTVSMLPILIGYVGAYTANSKKAVLLQIILFILGFSLVLALLGLAASLLGKALGSLVGYYWYYVLGILAILMGFQLLEWIQLPLPQIIKKLPSGSAGSLITPLAMGAAFGATSSPCGTPFLTAILGFMSLEKNWLLGTTSLLCYALGQSVLLLIAGLFTGLVKHMATFRKVGWLITRLSGFVFVAAGVLLIAKVAGWF